MQGTWHDFDIWRQRQRELFREAEAHRFARTARPDWRERLGKYRDLLDRLIGRTLGLPSRAGFPPDEEVAPSGTGTGLVEALFEVRARPVASSSVIEYHQEEKGYVIREVDLGSGDLILYLSTEEPEWAAWIWERKTHG